MAEKPKYQLAIANPETFRDVCEELLSKFPCKVQLASVIMDAVNDDPNVKSVMLVVNRLHVYDMLLLRHMPRVICLMCQTKEDRLAALADFATQEPTLESSLLLTTDCQIVQAQHCDISFRNLAEYRHTLCCLSGRRDRVRELVSNLKKECTAIAAGDEELLQALMLHAAQTLTVSAIDEALLTAFIAKSLTT